MLQLCTTVDSKSYLSRYYLLLTYSQLHIHIFTCRVQYSCHHTYAETSAQYFEIASATDFHFLLHLHPMPKPSPATLTTRQRCASSLVASPSHKACLLPSASPHLIWTRRSSVIGGGDNFIRRTSSTPDLTIFVSWSLWLLVSAAATVHVQDRIQLPRLRPCPHQLARRPTRRYPACRISQSCHIHWRGPSAHANSREHIARCCGQPGPVRVEGCHPGCLHRQRTQVHASCNRGKSAGGRGERDADLQLCLHTTRVKW